MVRLFSLSLLTVFAGAALASSGVEQLVLSDPSILTSKKWSYDDCGTSSDPVHIKSIEIVPDPPKPGHDLTVTVSATTDDIIKEGAYADVTVKLGRIRLLKKQFDVCQEARAANASIQCPVKEGDYVVSHTVALPAEIPPAKFNINVKGYTKEDESLVCLDLEVDLMNLPW